VKNQIIEKLNQHIGKNLNEEADVVYLFVQIRKLLEQENRLGEFPILQFYCNWIVYPRLNYLDRNPGMKDVLDKLEKAIELETNGGSKDDVLSLFSDTLSLKKLWKELNDFFRSYDEFNPDILNKPEPWSNLGGLLINILTDLPLIPPIGSYKYIKEFCFKLATDDTHLARIQIKSLTGKIYDGPITYN